MTSYQIKITLMGIEPPVWRRIQVPADITLEALHDIAQIAMGWEDAHLHLFIVNGEEYGATDPEFGTTIHDEREALLGQLAKPGDRLAYVYDFGDDWEHEIRIERVLHVETTEGLPRCIGGERACPPEDCGGAPGYARLLQILADPDHEEHEDMLDWLGDEALDPEAFDPEGINCCFAV